MMKACIVLLCFFTLHIYLLYILAKSMFDYFLGMQKDKGHTTKTSQKDTRPASCNWGPEPPECPAAEGWCRRESPWGSGRQKRVSGGPAPQQGRRGSRARSPCHCSHTLTSVAALHHGIRTHNELIHLLHCEKHVWGVVKGGVTLVHGQFKPIILGTFGISTL